MYWHVEPGWKHFDWFPWVVRRLPVFFFNISIFRKHRFLLRNNLFWAIYLSLEFVIDHRSYTHNSIKLKPENNSGLNGFEPMTSAILVECSTKPSKCQAIWELVTLWVCNIPVEGERMQINIWIFQALISQLLKLCVWQRWSIVNSYLSPQFKYLIFHVMGSCIYSFAYLSLLSNFRSVRKALHVCRE